VNVSRPRSFPNEQQELLLRAALLEREPAVDAWERWKGLTGGIEQHDHASFRLLPLLYRKLSAYGVEEPQVERLKGVYRHAWYCNQRLFHEAEGVLQDFEQAGIPTILLKGAALTQLYYLDPGTRPMDDLDVLVPPERAEEAFHMLAANGWRRKTGVPFRTLRFSNHATGFVDGRGRELDLHWNALWQPAADQDFWAAAVPVKIRDASALALCPADQLLHVAIHGTGWNGAPVRWVADAMTILGAAASDIDWDRVVERSAARHLTLQLAPALRYLQDAFGAPVPAEAIARVEAVRPTRGERLAQSALENRMRHGSAYALHWDRWRRLRTQDPTSGAPASFVSYMQASWSAASRRDLARRLARKGIQIARHGRSHPRGEPLARQGEGS
jgi:hypothetical protein